MLMQSFKVLLENVSGQWPDVMEKANITEETELGQWLMWIQWTQLPLD